MDKRIASKGKKVIEQPQTNGSRGVTISVSQAALSEIVGFTRNSADLISALRYLVYEVMNIALTIEFAYDAAHVLALLVNQSIITIIAQCKDEM